MAAQTGGAVARGVAWMLLARIADRVGGILAIAISARFLAPNDFGMFQMALSIVIIVELFSMLGFEWAMVRHPNPTREHFDTAFTLQLIVSGAASLVVVALAWPFAGWYRTPELVQLTLVLAITPLLFGINNLALVHLRREMRFETDFWRMFVPRIASLTASIVLAIALESYWALVVGVLVARGMSTLMGYILHPYRPRLSLAKWRELMAFSVWMQLNTVIEGMRGRVADLVIGRHLGSHPLAIFNMSNELASLPQAEFVGALNSAVFPKYARLQDDVSQLRAAYLDILSLTLLVGLPVACGLAFVAPSAVRVLLGPSWAETAPIIQIIAFGAFANAVAANTAFVLLTAGRPNLNTCLSGLTLVALVALLVWLTAMHGIKGAATAYTLTAFAALPVHVLVLRRLIGVRLRDIAPRAWRSLLAVGLMCLALWPIVPETPPQSLTGALYALAMGMAAGGSVYVAAISALWVASGRPASIERLLMTTALDIAVRVDARLLGSRLARRT